MAPSGLKKGFSSQGSLANFQPRCSVFKRVGTPSVSLAQPAHRCTKEMRLGCCEQLGWHTQSNAPFTPDTCLASCAVEGPGLWQPKIIETPIPRQFLGETVTTIYLHTKTASILTRATFSPMKTRDGSTGQGKLPTCTFAVEILGLDHDCVSPGECKEDSNRLPYFLTCQILFSRKVQYISCKAKTDELASVLRWQPLTYLTIHLFLKIH